MKQNLGSPNLDLYYAQMKGPTIAATIQMTAVTGTIIGCIASLIVLLSS